jgi:hypothetical protein
VHIAEHSPKWRYDLATSWEASPANRNGKQQRWEHMGTKSWCRQLRQAKLDCLDANPSVFYQVTSLSGQMIASFLFLNKLVCSQSSNSYNKVWQSVKTKSLLKKKAKLRHESGAIPATCMEQSTLF